MGAQQHHRTPPHPRNHSIPPLYSTTANLHPPFRRSHSLLPPKQEAAKRRPLWYTLTHFGPNHHPIAHVSIVHREGEGQEGGGSGVERERGGGESVTSR